MSDHKMTPEEKLLKVIENPPGATNIFIPSGKLAKSPALSAGPRAFDVAVFSKDYLLPHLTLQTVNKILIVLAVSVTILWIVNFTRSYSTLQDRFCRIQQNSSSIVSDSAQSLSGPESFAFDGSAAAKRNIFSMSPEQPDSVLAQASPDQFLSAIKLVGVIWSDNPQAMIEDTKEQKTYLVGTGDQVGQFTAKKILSDRVVLENNGREYQLR